MIRSQRFGFDQVGDGLAVADSMSNDVSLLNASAAIVWCVLFGGPSTIDEIHDEVLAFWPVSSEEIGTGILSTLNYFERRGWVECVESGAWQICDQRRADNSATLTSARPLLHPMTGSVQKLLWSRTVALSLSPIRLELRGSLTTKNTDDFMRMSGFLCGLPEAEPSPSVKTLSMIFDPSGVTIETEENRQEFPDLLTASSVLVLSLLKLANPDHFAHTVVHAAAVSCSKGTIILPAISGSGKTTLTAYLTAKGWRYGGDDIIGLARTSPSDRISLLPLPTAMGIKEGSVDVLSADYPELSLSPIVSYGSKKVRYTAVDPSLVSPATGNWRSPGAIVFPTYTANSACELSQLSEWEALELLLEAGTGTGSGTDLDSFDLLVELIKSVPCFRLRYARLEDARAQLEGLL
jgi:hypothetical protein